MNVFSNLKTIAAAALETFRADGWTNPVTGLGTIRDKAEAAEFAPNAPLSDDTLESIFEGDDLAYRVVSAPVEMMLRQGLRAKAPTEVSPEVAKRVEQAIDRLGVVNALEDAATWGRLYGRAAILLGSESTERSSEPRNPEAPLEWIKVLEKRDFSPETSALDDDGQPVRWRLNADGTLVHASRLLLFGGAKTPDRARLRLSYSDHSVLHRSIRAIRDVHAVWGGTAHLITDAGQGVYKIKGLFDMLANGDTEALLLRMAMNDRSRSTVRGMLVDMEGEDFTRQGLQVSGLPEVCEMAFKRLSASTGIPVTVLMGVSPAGLNATGESDIRGWYSIIESARGKHVTPAAQTLLDAICTTEKAGLGWVVEWPSLWTMDPGTEADYKGKVLETDIKAIDAGLLTPEEVAAHRYSGRRDAWFTDVAIDLELRSALATPLTGGVPNAPTP